MKPTGVRAGTAWIVLTSVVVSGLMRVAPGQATHEIAHRYLVLGYVQDERGWPLPRSPVRAVRDRTGLSYETKAEDDGFYFLVIHLHDDDPGDVLRVTAAGASVTVEARFVPGEASNHRGTRIDFRAGRARERRELFPGTLADYLNR